MPRLLSTLIFLGFIFISVGCANHYASVKNSTQKATNFIKCQSVIKTTPGDYPAKNVQHITLFTAKKTPHAPYRIIAVAKVSKTNILGKEREALQVEAMLKQLAASVGGDGIINIQQQHDGLEGKVIAFQKILI